MKRARRASKRRVKQEEEQQQEQEQEQEQQEQEEKEEKEQDGGMFLPTDRMLEPDEIKKRQETHQVCAAKPNQPTTAHRSKE